MFTTFGKKGSMKYNFDEKIDRQGTYAFKYEGVEKYIHSKDKDVLPLWVADMDFRVAPSISRALTQRAKHEVYGYTMLPQKVSKLVKKWLEKHHSWRVEDSWLSYPPGILVGIAAAVLAFTRPNDKIIVQKPVYFPFFSIIKNLERELVNNELIERGLDYTFDYDDLDRKAANSKLLILCNPQNPSGRVWKREELLKIAEIAQKYGLIVISDEAHADLVFRPNKHTPFATVSTYAAENSITLMALSKGFNVAGLYCAYAICKSKKLKIRYDKWLYGLMVTHGRHVFADQAFLAAYSEEGEEWLRQVKGYIYENILLVDNFLKSKLKAVKMKKPEATFLVWLDFRELKFSQRELIKFLTEEAKLGLHSGTIFGQASEGFMRMNVAHPGAVIQEALNRLKNAYYRRFS